ncbi:MAG: hypothetical protein ACR2Q4_24885 [Geminicoccaceae bacterium]
MLTIGLIEVRRDRRQCRGIDVVLALWQFQSLLKNGAALTGLSQRGGCCCQCAFGRIPSLHQGSTFELKAIGHTLYHRAFVSKLSDRLAQPLLHLEGIERKLACVDFESMLRTKECHNSEISVSRMGNPDQFAS